MDLHRYNKSKLNMTQHQIGHNLKKPNTQQRTRRQTKHEMVSSESLNYNRKRRPTILILTKHNKNKDYIELFRTIYTTVHTTQTPQENI
jgi:hypothetical protein